MTEIDSEYGIQLLLNDAPQLLRLRLAIAGLDQGIVPTIEDATAIFREVQLLQNLDAITATDDMQRTILHHMFKHIGSLKPTIAMLLSKIRQLAPDAESLSAVLNAQDSSGNTPLHFAILSDNPLPLDLLCDAFALNIRNAEGHTALTLQYMKHVCVNCDLYYQNSDPEINKELSTIQEIKTLAHIFALNTKAFKVKYDNGIAYQVPTEGSRIDRNQVLVQESLMKFMHGENYDVVNSIYQQIDLLTVINPNLEGEIGPAMLEKLTSYFALHGILAVAHNIPNHVCLDIYTKYTYFHVNCGFGTHAHGLRAFARPDKQAIDWKILKALSISHSDRFDCRTMNHEFGLAEIYQLRWPQQTVGNCSLHMYRLLYRSLFFIENLMRLLSAEPNRSVTAALKLADVSAQTAEAKWYQHLRITAFKNAITKMAKLSFNHDRFLMLCIADTANVDFVLAKKCMKQFVAALVSGKEQRQAENHYLKIIDKFVSYVEDIETYTALLNYGLQLIESHHPETIDPPSDDWSEVLSSSRRFLISSGEGRPSPRTRRNTSSPRKKREPVAKRPDKRPSRNKKRRG